MSWIEVRNLPWRESAQTSSGLFMAKNGLELYE